MKEIGQDLEESIEDIVADDEVVRTTNGSIQEALPSASTPTVASDKSLQCNLQSQRLFSDKDAAFWSSFLGKK